jgi:hypothetical protein
MQSAIFLSQRKMKNEAMLLVVSAKAPIFQFVVPANAGTHHHRRWFCEGSLALCLIGRSRGMGPRRRRGDAA